SGQRLTVAANVSTDLGKTLGGGTIARLVWTGNGNDYIDQGSGIHYQAVAGAQGTKYQPIGVDDVNGQPLMAADSTGKPLQVVFRDEHDLGYVRTVAGDLIPVLNHVDDPDHQGTKLKLVLKNPKDGIYADPSSDRT